MARAGFVSKFEGELMKNAKHIATPGKGIFAADESTGTIGKRLENTKGKNVEANPQALRKLLTAQKALPDMYLSGLILSEDTLDQTTAAGKLDAQVLKAADVLPGIKFHNVKPAEEFKASFKHRCREYYEAGARFAELHAILKINGETEPSKQAIQQNAEGLASYAFICQENGLVPIVGPEVLTDGDHNIARCAAVTETVLAAVYNSLIDNHVLLEGTLLKPNMVTPGSDHPKVAAKEIAKHTVTALRRTVPAAVPGIVFLSGGQSEEEATQNVNAMNNVKVLKPWTLSFSFGQALQQSALETWRGKKENEEKAQKAFLARCKANSEATLGKYTDGGSSSYGGPLYKAAYKR